MTSRARGFLPGLATLALLALLAASGCDNGTTPTSPSSGGLQVSASRTVLRAGETLALTVTQAGTPVTVASWTSTDTSVVVVGATGQATAGRAGRATVTATAGGTSGSLSLRVASDYSGRWTGGVARPQLTCNPVSTTPICVPGAATSGTITLQLTQIGDQVTGTLADSAEPTAPVPVTGQVRDDDQLELAGRVDVPATTPTSRVEVTNLRAAYDVALGTITGSYALSVDRARGGAALQDDYRAQVQFRDLRR